MDGVGFPYLKEGKRHGAMLFSMNTTSTQRCIVSARIGASGPTNGNLCTSGSSLRNGRFTTFITTLTKRIIWLLALNMLTASDNCSRNLKGFGVRLAMSTRQALLQLLFPVRAASEIGDSRTEYNV